MFCNLANSLYICILHCIQNNFGTLPELIHGANINNFIDMAINIPIDLR